MEWFLQSLIIGGTIASIMVSLSFIGWCIFMVHDWFYDRKLEIGRKERELKEIKADIRLLRFDNKLGVHSLDKRIKDLDERLG